MVSADTRPAGGAKPRRQRRKWSRRRRLLITLAVLLVAGLAGWYRLTLHPGRVGPARLYQVNGTWVVELAGQPAELGYQHGRLLKHQLKLPFSGHPLGLVAPWLGHPYERWRLDAPSYEKFIPEHLLEELRGIARGADVDYEDVLVEHTFLEPLSEPACSFYAVYGGATADGRLIVGYNLEHHGLIFGERFTMLFDVRPEEGHRFVSIAWPGFAGSVAAVNDRGLIAVLNNAGTRHFSREGMPYAFLVREIVQSAGSVDEAMEYLKKAKRTVGNIVLLAQSDPPRAVAAEFDAENIAFREAEDGVLIATNTFRTLYQTQPLSLADGKDSRYNALLGSIRANYGHISSEKNFLNVPGVYQDFGVFSVLFHPGAHRFRLASGRMPAAEQPFRDFTITTEGIGR